MKGFQCFKVASFCLFLIFIVYVIRYPKENLKSYELESEVQEIGKPKLFEETSLPTKSLK